MNERMQQLAEQSYEDFQTLTSPKYLVFNKEKFAESIVRECAEVLDETISPPSHPMNSIGYRLKEHFGIEV